MQSTDGRRNASEAVSASGPPPERAAPPALGASAAGYASMDNAPGRYVHEK